MNDLVTINGQQVVTTSRNVAEHFEKRHDNVVQAVETLMGGLLKSKDTPKNLDVHKMFRLSSYKNEQNGQTYPEYLMNRDGFSLLVMGFTGAKALAWKLKYIEAFNAMEAQLANIGKDSYMIADPIERAKKWIEEEEVRKAQAAEIEAARPKVVFADAVATSNTCILIGALAKLLKQNGIDIGQKRLFAWMRENGYLIKSGNDKNMPTQRAMDRKLFEVKEGSYVDGNGVNRTTRTTKVTGKGQQYFINKFLADKEEDKEKDAEKEKKITA